MPPAAVVGMDLTGVVIPVSESAVITRKRSVIPPLPDEAYASPGLWEMRSPLESLPDDERGSASSSQISQASFSRLAKEPGKLASARLLLLFLEKRTLLQEHGRETGDEGREFCTK